MKISFNLVLLYLGDFLKMSWFLSNRLFIITRKGIYYPFGIIFFMLIPLLITNQIVHADSVESSYFTKILERENYDYGPSIIREGDNFYMWFTGDTNGETIDRIYYSSSSDGISWSTPISVISESGRHVALPSVVKVNSTYHMYFTKATGTGFRNQIYHATSSDRVNWQQTAQPVISIPNYYFTNNIDKYCVDHANVIYKDGLYYLYFVYNDALFVSDDPRINRIFHVYSYNGVDFYNVPDGVYFPRDNNMDYNFFEVNSPTPVINGGVGTYTYLNRVSVKSDHLTSERKKFK